MRWIVFLFAAGLSLAGEAAAFDCAKATTDTEKAICADPALKAADDAMAAAYEAVMPKLDAKQQAALKANQQAWLKTREEYCGPVAESRAECIKTRTEQRTNFLIAKPESGPGLATPVVPHLVSKPQTDKTCSGEAAMHIFPPPASSPGEKAFNAEIEKLITSTEGDNGAREVTPDYQYDCDWSLDSTITYASADLIAVAIDMYAFGGGAHGNYARLPLVVDLKSGQTPAFGDIFPDSAKGDLVKACTDGIRAEKIKRFSDVGDPESTKELLAGLDESMKEYAETIAAGVANFAQWIVYADRAEIYFAPYELGSYAEGDYTCPLARDLLAKTAGSKGWIIP